jgi:hypothetical protein
MSRRRLNVYFGDSTLIVLMKKHHEPYDIQIARQCRTGSMQHYKSTVIDVNMRLYFFATIIDDTVRR